MDRNTKAQAGKDLSGLCCRGVATAPYCLVGRGQGAQVSLAFGARRWNPPPLSLLTGVIFILVYMDSGRSGGIVWGWVPAVGVPLPALVPPAPPLIPSPSSA